MWLPYGYERDMHFSNSAFQLTAILQADCKGTMIIEPAGWVNRKEQLKHFLASLS